MIKKQNSRCGIAVLATLTVVLSLGACGARLTADEKVDLARSELKQGKAAEAVIHLRNVLQEDPSNVPARVLLAESAVRVGDLETAVKEYRRALDLGADIDEFRLRYAEALVRAGAGEEALRVTDPEEAGDAAPVLYWRGLALLRTGATDEAEALFQRIAQDPEMRVRVQIGLARVALARQESEAALAILDGISGEAVGLSEYWEAMAFAYMQSGQPGQAAAAFAKAADTVVDAQGSQRFMYRGGEVEALLAAGQLADARSRAESMLKQIPRHPFANYLMGRVELQAGNPQQALAYGQAVLAAQPDSTQGHLIIGMAHLGMEQNAQAERSLARAVAVDPGNMIARRMLAQTRLGMQSPEGALEALGPITEDSLDSGIANLAGIASVRAGDPVAAIEIFRRQLERDPADDEARSMLAVSLMAAGRVEEALAELKRVSATDAAVRQQADLIEIAAHLQGRALDEAREASARVAAAHPGDAALRANLGGLFLSGNHMDEASAWLEESLALDPDNAAARFNAGRIAAAMGQLDRAREQFEAIVAADPGNGAAVVALAQVEWARGEREAAVARLQKARAAEPGDANSRLLLTSYLVTLNRIAEAREVAEEALVAAPDSAAVANALGAVLLQAGNAQEALPEFTRAHRITPGVPLYLINKARAETAIGQLDVARETLVRALALDPDSFVALSLMVAVERRLGRLEGAARTLARLERVAPAGDARVEISRGTLLLEQEDYAGAERAFASALESGIDSRAAIGIYEARRRAGTGDAAEPLLDWLGTRPDDTQVRVILAAHYIDTSKHPAAIEQYEKLLEGAPESALFLNNIAWLYNEVGDPRALDMAERAHTLVPDDPMVADTYGWILHQRGDSKRALELIRKAAEAAPQVGEIQYHLAVLLAETDDEAGAIKAARAVLAEPTAANFHEPAQKLLDRLGQGKE